MFELHKIYKSGNFLISFFPSLLATENLQNHFFLKILNSLFDPDKTKQKDRQYKGGWSEQVLGNSLLLTKHV